ncbi:uncharacterized protein LODBEIA_P60530 [Lodderomyces beijingensis]|uniref:Uncharacterized protein n=1 Tax=Lodderomyces beijingensis TaxID=1775926 RepID=A0ABP0ZUL3_9ASCO
MNKYSSPVRPPLTTTPSPPTSYTTTQPPTTTTTTTTITTSTSTTKRRTNDASSEDHRRKTALLDETLINSDPEWPQFHSPEGGIIKITPWGVIRQSIDPHTGEILSTKFEDSTLSELQFTNAKTEALYSMPPSTPESIELHHQPSISSLQSEHIVKEVRFSDHHQEHQYGVEQENYFGMNDYSLEDDDTMQC